MIGNEYMFPRWVKLFGTVRNSLNTSLKPNSLFTTEFPKTKIEWQVHAHNSSNKKDTILICKPRLSLLDSWPRREKQIRNKKLWSRLTQNLKSPEHQFKRQQIGESFIFKKVLNKAKKDIGAKHRSFYTIPHPLRTTFPPLSKRMEEAVYS